MFAKGFEMKANKNPSRNKNKIEPLAIFEVHLDNETKLTQQISHVTEMINGC